MLDSFRFDKQKKLLSKEFSSSEANLDYYNNIKCFKIDSEYIRKLDNFLSNKFLDRFNFRYDSYLLTKEELNETSNNR